MEQETMLKEILNALKAHGEQMDQRFVEMDEKFEKRFVEMDEKFEKRFVDMDEKFAKIDARFDKIDDRFDRLDKKVDGIRADLSETQETTDFLLSKTAKHEKKLRHL